jgi:hypothetical protein
MEFAGYQARRSAAWDARSKPFTSLR